MRLVLGNLQDGVVCEACREPSGSPFQAGLCLQPLRTWDGGCWGAGPGAAGMSFRVSAQGSWGRGSEGLLPVWPPPARPMQRRRPRAAPPLCPSGSVRLSGHTAVTLWAPSVGSPDSVIRPHLSVRLSSVCSPLSPRPSDSIVDQPTRGAAGRRGPCPVGGPELARRWERAGQCDGR